MVRCRDATAISFIANVRGEVFSHLHIAVVSGIDCLACQDKFFANNPLDVKENVSMLLALLFTCFAFFVLGEFGLFHWEDCCFVSWS
jgi:hypothetical protein